MVPLLVAYSVQRQKFAKKVFISNERHLRLQKLPFPKSLFFIIGNEFCERFSYYGMKAILVLYFKQKLHFSEDLSTQVYHAFSGLCYLFPIFGAMLADQVRSKTIIVPQLPSSIEMCLRRYWANIGRSFGYRSYTYLDISWRRWRLFQHLGCLLCESNSSMNYNLESEVNYFCHSSEFSLIGLFLIAVGTGGIKPCVSAFGGDQFKLPEQERQLQTFFSVFYFAINAGTDSLKSIDMSAQIWSGNQQVLWSPPSSPPSFVRMSSASATIPVTRSHLVSPRRLWESPLCFSSWARVCTWWSHRRGTLWQKSSDLYTWVLGLTGVTLSVIQWSSTRWRNGHGSLSSSPSWRCSFYSFRFALFSYFSSCCLFYLQYALKRRITSGSGREHWMDYAKEKYDNGVVEDVKCLLKVLWMYLPLPMFWALFDQLVVIVPGNFFSSRHRHIFQGSRWTFQATRMNGSIGSFSIKPDQMQLLNPALILLLIPLFDMFIYPAFAKYDPSLRK